MERVFEPFFTTKDFTTKDTGQGTGLGLSTVHGIIKQCGGDIFIDSSPEQGTTLRAYLPITEGSTTAPTPQHPKRAGHGDELILVVEDEKPVRDLVRQILAKRGYRVLAVSSGGEAIAECDKRDGAIDLVLTDMIMPGIAGTVLANQLVAKFPQMQILYMSGYTGDAMMRLDVADQDIHCITKPFTTAQLCAEVRQALDTSRTSAGSIPTDGND